MITSNYKTMSKIALLAITGTMIFFLEASIMALPTAFVVNDTSKKTWAQIALLQEPFFKTCSGQKRF